ncbi:hypothetical protein BW892_06775 [Bacillus cereus]|uniref:RNA methyltransferase n=1 Tax=Bacillus cereus TaxID=1396 RepID=A0A1S9V708_BACCE|nr:hypothetical protein BW892_06775 [Bacillus cereus]
MKPKRVVYVSCNLATLACDLKVLEEGGYKIQEVQPVDMFLHTTHVECISQLILKKGNYPTGRCLLTFLVTDLQNCIECGRCRHSYSDLLHQGMKHLRR